MAGYSAISDVGNAIIKLLSRNMVPEIIPTADSIGLCSPDERGDLVLGVYLYDVHESDEIAGNRSSVTGEKSQRFPSSFLNLHFSITAYSTSDIRFRASEEQRILGKVTQIMSDNPVLQSEAITSSTYPVRIEMQRMDSEEKMKLGNLPNMPKKLSLYYKVYPIEIESMRTKTITRVVDIDFEVDQKPEV